MTVTQIGLLLASINSFLFLFFFITDSYPLFLIIIHIVSLILFWSWIINRTTCSLFFKKNRWDIAIMILIFIAGLAIRLYRVDQITPGMWGDEVGYAILGEQVVDAHMLTPFTPDLFAPPTPFFYIIGWTVKTLGRTLITVRLPALIFGALGVVMGYRLLRSIFSRKIALMGTLVMLVLYHHLIISRFAYEMSAAVFFEFLTIFFLYRAYRSDDLRDYTGTVFSLAAGLYSYVAFRTNAIAFMVVVTLLILRRKDHLLQNIIRLGLVYVLFFVSLTPWLAFSLRHPDHVMARAKAISVFHQGFSAQRTITEILGSARNSLGMFFITGDPNPRQNPSHVAMYDPVFVSISLIGVWYLVRKQKKLAIAGLFFMIPSFVNDIFSIELFPEFHFAGTGHPSATRVLGLIPIMIVFFSAGFSFLERVSFFNKGKGRYIGWIISGSLVAITVFINWRLYFNQPPSEFIYKANKVQMIDAVTFINRAATFNTFTVAMSDSIFNDQRVQYFSDPKVKRISLKPESGEITIDQIPLGIYTLIDTSTAPVLSEKLIQGKFQREHNLEVNGIPTVWKTVNTLIVFRKG